MKTSLNFFLLLLLAMPISFSMSGCGKKIPDGAPTSEGEINAAAEKAAETDDAAATQP